MTNETALSLAGATVEITPPTTGAGRLINTGTGLIEGFGALTADVESDGEIRPGGAAGAPGTLTISGDYTQFTVDPIHFGQGRHTGDLFIDLTSLAPGTGRDALAVGGAANLAGGLFVSLAPGVSPQSGDRFTILTASSITGQFDVALLPGLPGDLFMRVEYNLGGASGASVDLVVANLSDLVGFNDDGGPSAQGVASAVVTGDFDQRDGVDLAVALPSLAPTDPGSALILLNGGVDASGQWLNFSGGVVQIGVGRNPQSLVAGDFDGIDGPDLAVANTDDSSVSVLLNAGVGGGGLISFFSASGSPAPVGAGPVAVNVGDFDLDGDPDIVTANSLDDTASILLNDGAGLLTPQAPLVVGPSPTWVAVADFDRINGPDLAVTSGASTTVGIYTNNGVVAAARAVGFTLRSSVDVDDDQDFACPGDLDNDKLLDLATINRTSQTISIALNTGNCTFTPAVNLPIGATATSLVMVDLEGDGDLDLAFTSDDGQPVVRALRNDLFAGQLQFAQTVELPVGLVPSFVVAGDVNVDGRNDLIAVSVDPGIGGAMSRAPSKTQIKDRKSLDNAPTRPSDALDPRAPSTRVFALLNTSRRACVADLNGDGQVSVFDLAELLTNWGLSNTSSDITGDGTVNVFDLAELLSNWGPCP